MQSFKQAWWQLPKVCDKWVQAVESQLQKMALKFLSLSAGAHYTKWTAYCALPHNICELFIYESISTHTVPCCQVCIARLIK